MEQLRDMGREERRYWLHAITLKLLALAIGFLGVLWLAGHDVGLGLTTLVVATVVFFLSVPAERKRLSLTADRTGLSPAELLRRGH